jgi:hypothetical protein
MRRFIHLSGLSLLLVVVTSVFAASRTDAQESDSPTKSSLPATSAYVPPIAIGAVIFRPQALIGYPAFPSASVKMMPLEVIEAWGRENFGMNPLSIAEIKIMVGMPTGTQPPPLGMVITTLEDFDPGNLSADLLADSGPIETRGGKLYPLALRGVNVEMVLESISPRTVLIGDRLTLQSMRNAAEGNGPLADLLRANRIGTADMQVAVAVQPLRPILSQVASQPPPDAPREIKELIQGIVLVNSVVARLKWDGAAAVTRLEVLADDAKGAAELLRVVEGAMDYGKAQAIAGIDSSMAGQEPGPVNDAIRGYMRRMVEELTTIYRPKLAGDRLTLDYRADTSVATTGVLVGLLLPAVQASREAARRMSSTNNLKQIALAMYNYHDTYGHFPPAAITSPTGEPLLSWRVALLPFLEEQALYSRFKLDEPWNSPNNLALVREMPKVFADPSIAGPAGTESGLTNYHLAIGDNFLTKPTGKTRLAEITDGTSNTIMAIAGNDDSLRPWTSTDDVKIDPVDPLANFRRANGFVAAFGDGSVSMIAPGIDPQQFKAALTRNGGEAVSIR